MADRVVHPGAAAEGRWVAERLLEILDAAVLLQPETESVLHAAAAGGTKAAVLARRAGRLTSALLYLVDRANVLPRSLVVEEARGLLRFHHRLLTESLEQALRSGNLHGPLGRERNLPDPGLPEASASLNEPASFDEPAFLGEPAARLRGLRSLIADELTRDPA